MRYLLAILLISFISSYTWAANLNKKGKKMVAEIRVEYADSLKWSPYNISFGYDNNTLEINSITYRRSGVNDVLTQLFRNEEGNIKREDYYDGKLARRYTFKIDSERRPIEMVEYEKNIYGNFVKVQTFYFDYDFNDYSLSILSIDNGDEWAAKRDLVKMIDGDAYTLSNGVNLKTGKETTPKLSDRKLLYGDRINDLNVDLYQIINGYCSVSISLQLLESNYLSLVGWIPIISKHLPMVSDRNVIEYIEKDDNIEQVKIISKYTGEDYYTMFISYVE